MTMDSLTKAKDYIVSWAKKWLLDFLFKKILGGVVGGIKGWLLTTVFNKVWKEMIQPRFDWAFRELGAWWRKREYMRKAKAVKDAKTKDELRDSFDDMP
jgi:hypothetical protein